MVGRMLGLLYDVHGNLPALDAVLDDAGDVDRWLLGGDYTLFGAWPDETLERLRGLDAVWIRGNGERWTAAPDEAPEPVRAAISWCAGMLGRDVVAEMAALPETHRDGATLYCHASPGSDVRQLPAGGRARRGGAAGGGGRGAARVRPHPPAVRARIRVRDRAGQPRQRRHAVRRRPPRRIRGAWATTARIEHRRVEYNHMASAAAVRGALGPAGEVPAARIERASAQVG